MKFLSYLTGILIVTLSLGWALRFNAYFFRSSFEDDFTLFITVLLSSIAFYIFRSAEKNNLLPFLAGVVSWILFGVNMILVEQTNWGSIGLHVFLVFTVATVVNSLKSRFLFLHLMSLIGVHFYPWNFPEGQERYYDRVELDTQTRKGSGQVVKWKNDKWYYYNDQLLSSTVDNHVWREAYIQPIMQLVPNNSKVLLIGGESGELRSELKKFNIQPTILPYDVEFQRLTQGRRLIRDQILVGEIHQSLGSFNSIFDFIIIDLPDPINVEFKQFYTKDFFGLCLNALNNSGFMITHSGDILAKNIPPKSIWNNAQTAGFKITPYHAQIPTIGHWTWFIGAKDSTDVKAELQNTHIKSETKWWNQEAMDMMLSFGKYELLEDR